ncbi:PIG-L family deacetylase [Candidatus Bathyarchaeota archaeon]|nr:PIG-L family deacetylase [Candidatus Bathyarchaeota archaeon]
MRRVLAIVSHPDDETFGCGGALALNARQGGLSQVLCLTSDPPERGDELTAACAALDISRPIIMGLEKISADGSTIRKVSDHIASFRPDVVITHLPTDYHRDHRETYEVVKEAVEWAAHTTTYEEPWLVGRLLLMEVNTLISSPHVLIDVSDVWALKEAAVECYPTQLAKFEDGYYQRFTRAKAELRGVQGGCGYAEAFIEEPLQRSGPFYEVKASKSL